MSEFTNILKMFLQDPECRESFLEEERHNGGLLGLVTNESLTTESNKSEVSAEHSGTNTESRSIGYINDSGITVLPAEWNNPEDDDL